MEIYFSAWKILGVIFLLFLAYTFFVVRQQKKKGLGDNNLEKH